MANTYTPQQRTEAVDAYLEHGATEAARITGIPKRTINRWATDDGATSDKAEQTQTARDMLAQANAKRREELRALLMEKAVDLMRRMDEPHIDFKGKDAFIVTYPKATSGDVRNYAVSVGVLIDKFRLEMGEATGRTESIDLSAAESRIDQEIERLSALHAQS